MRTRDKARSVGAICLGALSWAVVLAAGCSPGAQRPLTLNTDKKAAIDPGEPSAPTMDVAVDPGGFTITQRVNVMADVRTDYESAVRMLGESRYEPAIALLLDVTERAPEVTAAHISLGVAHARVGDLDQAEACLQRALELSPEHPVAHNELGLVQRRKGRFEDSRASYQAALANFTDFHYAHMNLAILCDLYLGDRACALEHYEAYRRIVPNDPEVGKWIVDLRNREIRQETP